MAKKKRRKSGKKKALSAVMLNFNRALRQAKKEPGGATHQNIMKHLKPVK